MSNNDTVKVAVVGIGNRGIGLLGMLFNMPDVEVLAVCDKRDDKLENAREKAISKEKDLDKILFTKDYKEVLAMEEVQAVINTTSWASHIDVAVDAMEAGKDVSIEVGGTNTIRDCWRLVEAQEKTGKRCMMLENCCYGRTELGVWNMARKGMFGEIVHCTGGYRHDLRYLLEDMAYNGRERLLDYIHRNCENYPTHALGPIAKILDINRGNRMVSLTSTASSACGMERYVDKYCPENHLLKGQRYTQGDIITTVIKCAHGQTITLSLDTTLPSPYSRHFGVRGTDGMYSEDGNMVFLDDVHASGEKHGEKHETARSLWGNGDKYIEENEHPLWVENLRATNDNGKIGQVVEGGHASIDKLVMRAFIESIKHDLPTPIDVYDCAAWMCITPLSEESIANGGAPVAIPDFTRGKWMMRKFEQLSKWSI